VLGEVWGFLYIMSILQRRTLWAVDWSGEGLNEQTKAWLHEAAADFTRVAFGEQKVDFRAAKFTGHADFKKAQLAETALRRSRI
jgi:hypothetical protein